jgi:GNAT superfamily N-acetyltransferase
MFAIRPATVADVSTLLELIRGLAEYEKLLDAAVATEADLEQSLFGPERSAAEAILAEEDGVPVGFALFFTNYSTFLGKAGIYLEDLFVKPEYRGKGYGKALLKRVAEIAVSRGAGRMDWSVLDWNKPSIEFYESLGARNMSGWLGYRLTGEALQALGR